MPGNDSADRVHNFFSQDKFLQGPHHQQTVEGTWSVPNNNFLVGGQIGFPNSSTKDVNIQQSVTDRGQVSRALHGQTGLNFTRPTSNFGQNLFQRQQLNSNGYMSGNHVNQTRQDGANVSRGLSLYESHQGPGPQHQTKSLVGSDTSELPVTFNLFESQQQMLQPQSTMMQSFQKQQLGFSDMQPFQQQTMWRKMQELQKQKQLCQPDSRQQNAVNPISPFLKQLTGSYPSAMVNFPSHEDSLNSRLRTESVNANWLQRAASVVQGSPDGFDNSANHGQAHSSINLGGQEGDQSIYRDTHSDSLGNLTQFSEITVEKPSMERVTAFADNISANQYQACIEQTSMQEEIMLPRQGFPGENSFSHPSGQTVQQVNPVKRTASSQEIHLDIARSQEKTSSEDVVSQNEVTLDPTEARILYGSEDSIWSAFGESLDDCGDAGATLDNFQSGTWSALMQSAVAETSSIDLGKKEALDGLILNNTSIHSENQTSTHGGMQDTSLHNDMSSPLHLSVNNPNSSLGVQQLENNFSCEPGQRQGNSSQREGSNISSPVVLQNSFTDVHPTHQSLSRSGIHETNQVSYRGPWPPAQTGFGDQYGKSSVYNSVGSASCFADATMYEREKPSTHCQGYEQRAGTMGEGHGVILLDSCPPSHRSALPSQFFISQGSLQKGMNSHQSREASEIGETGPSQLPSSPAVQSLLPSSEKSVSAFNHNRSAFPEQVNHAFTNKIPGNYLSTSSSDCPRSGSQFQYQQMVKERGQPSKKQHDMSNSTQKNDMVSRSSSIEQPTETTFHNETWNPQHDDSDLLKGSSNQISVPESHSRGLVPPTSAKDVPVSQAMNDVAQQGKLFEMLPNMWNSIPGQPHLFGFQNGMTSSNALQFHQPNVLESNSFTPHKHGEQESIVGRSSPSVSVSSSMNKKGSPAQQDSTGKINMAQRDEWQTPEPASNNIRDSSPSNSVSMQNDLEAFGRSLMSSNSSHQNYSLFHQMQITESAETDPNERAQKRMKSSGSVEKCQQLISKAAKFSDEAVGQHSSVSSGDSKLPSFSGLKDKSGSKAHDQLGNVISHNIHSHSREDSQLNHDGNIPTLVKLDDPYDSPQMTPSWLNQYGGRFRNGQMLTECDARRGTASKTAELIFSHGKTYNGVHMSNSNEKVAAAGIGPGEIVNIQRSPIPVSAAVDPEPLVLNVTRSKKRDRATFQLTSWHKEVMQRSRNPLTIRMAEVNWAKAANRLTEKIEDEVKFSENGLLMLKTKRRITLVSQLMQQLLSPPKSAILSSDAEFNYDGVAYFVARLALGEACGILPYPNTDSDTSHRAVSLFSGKDNELEKANDQPVSKLVKGFIGRTQKLENDFLRLEKKTFLIDVKSECQELEKFSVINRFAKFHGRGQAEKGNASSSNGAANALRPCPQRYVTALPVPRSLPDIVPCLSL